MSRWAPLYATTNSGKTLFVCLMCGRISPTPDRTCPENPVVVDWKMSTTCAVLEELEAVAVDAGERHVRPGARIMLSVAKNGTALAQWESTDGNSHRVHAHIVSERPVQTVTAKPKGHCFERDPEGNINNCSLANGDTENTCQICEGRCPDRKRFQ